MGSRLGNAVRSVYREWHEAPWFVVLVIVVVAFVGPGVIYALWDTIRGLV